MSHKLERPSAALVLPVKSDLGLVGHDGDAGGVIEIKREQPARHGGHGRGRLPPHPGADGDRDRLPLLLQLARDQNRLEIPADEHTKAKAFQFSYRE